MSRQRNRALGWFAWVVLLLASAMPSLAQTPPQRVFTADQTAGDVTAFETDKPAVVIFRVPKTLPAPAYPTLNGPSMIARDPYVDTMLVTEQIGGAVVVVDPKSNDSIGQDLSGGPQSSHGGQIAGRITLSMPFPWGVSITPDGHLAFIGNFERAFANNIGSNSPTADLVSIIDVFRGIEIATVNVNAKTGGLCRGPIDVACSPDGQLCYVANFATNNVCAIKVSDFSVPNGGATGFPVNLPGAAGTQAPVDICVTPATAGSPSGTFVFVAQIDITGGGAGSVSFFDVPTHTTGTVGGLVAPTAPVDVFTSYHPLPIASPPELGLYIVDAQNNTVDVAPIQPPNGPINVLTQLLPAGAALNAPQQGLTDANDQFGYISETGGVRQFVVSSNIIQPTVFPTDGGPVGIALHPTMDVPVATKQNAQEAQVNGTAGSKKGLCFIATASYGDSPEVASLRAFRDLYLMPTKFGRALVDLYYESSPGVATLIADREPVAATVRGGLAPVVLFARVVMSLGAMLPSIAGLLALGAITLVVGRRLRARKAA